MKEDLKKEFPEWCKYDNEDHSLVIGDDIDSLMTGLLLQSVTKSKIGHFYNFKCEYTSKKIIKNVLNVKSNLEIDSLELGTINDLDLGLDKKIGCDMALTTGRCWDNHVTMINARDSFNSLSANPNTVKKISRGNYTSKYAGSTFLVAYSYYNMPLPKSKEGKLILLSIDSAYLGHYNEYFKETHNEWLRLLGMEELIDFLDTVSIEDFKEVKNKYRLSSKIHMYNGRLMTSVKIDDIADFFDFPVFLPSDTFIMSKRYGERKNINFCDFEDGDRVIRKNNKSFSFAITSTNIATYTMLK